MSAPRARVDGVLVVDKPRGPTSHDVVVRVRRSLGTREVGHAGTLDPMATGVLVVAVGEATKLVPWLTADDKVYRATVRLGATTRSLDADGEIVEERAPTPALLDALARAARGESAPVLDAAIARELARTEQLPPALSAIKVAGVASHRRARRGDEVELPPRPVAVRAIRLLGARLEPLELDVELEVAKGYYVRAFARDLAASLESVAHLVSLRRLRSGAFSLDEASPLEPEALAGACIPLAIAAARALPAVRLTTEGVTRARHGKVLFASDFERAPDATAAWLDASGAMVAIGAPEGEGFRVVRGFVDRAADA